MTSTGGARRDDQTWQAPRIGASRERGEVAVFADRADAGRQLAGCLEQLRGPDLVVLGLPRGGVVVAAEVARALHAPLDVLVVRKLGHPAQPELAVGALGEEGVRVLSSDPRVWQRLDEEAFTACRAPGGRPAGRAGGTSAPGAPARRPARTCRAGRGRRHRDRRDDAGRLPRRAGARRGPRRRRGAGRGGRSSPGDWPKPTRSCASTTPDPFQAVGLHYEDFSQTTDEEVLALLADLSTPEGSAAMRQPAPARDGD